MQIIQLMQWHSRRTTLPLDTRMSIVSESRRSVFPSLLATSKDLGGQTEESVNLHGVPKLPYISATNRRPSTVCAGGETPKEIVATTRRAVSQEGKKYNQEQLRKRIKVRYAVLGELVCVTCTITSESRRDAARVG